MGIRPLPFCLFLLTPLGLCGAVSAAEVPSSSIGTVGLTVSSTLPSALPIDAQALAEQLCGEEGEEWDDNDDVDYDRQGHAVKCQVIVKNDSHTLSDGEFSYPVNTRCGVWDITLSFDSPRARQESPLVLMALSEDPSRGVFTGAMEMNAFLQLANRETGQTADLTLRVGFNLAGPWALGPPEDPNSLLLLAKSMGGELLAFPTCVPAWVWEEYAFVEVHGSCSICFDGLTSYCTSNTNNQQRPCIFSGSLSGPQ